VIFAQGVVGAAAMQQATRSIPVVFAQVQDPVGGGFVTSLARPEANLTGFTDFEYSISGKWLQLLKEAAPHVTRALAIINPDNRRRWEGYFTAIDELAPALGIRPARAGVHDAGEIEQAVEAFAREPDGGLVVMPDATTSAHSKLIIALADVTGFRPFTAGPPLRGAAGFSPTPATSWISIAAPPPTSTACFAAPMSAIFRSRRASASSWC
jgi:putative ABC transport system substrate-binding protein